MPNFSVENLLQLINMNINFCMLVYFLRLNSCNKNCCFSWVLAYGEIAFWSLFLFSFFEIGSPVIWPGSDLLCSQGWTWVLIFLLPSWVLVLEAGAAWLWRFLFLWFRVETMFCTPCFRCTESLKDVHSVNKMCAQRFIPEAVSRILFVLLNFSAILWIIFYILSLSSFCG